MAVTLGNFTTSGKKSNINIYAHGTRALHAEAFVVSGLVCFVCGAFVVGQALGALLGGKGNG